MATKSSLAFSLGGSISATAKNFVAPTPYGRAPFNSRSARVYLDKGQINAENFEKLISNRGDLSANLLGS